VRAVNQREIESFRPLSARVTFSCLPKRKSPKRSAPRRSAHGTSMCRGSAQAGGSFRQHVHVLTKRWPTSCRPPFGLIHHPAPLRRGPLKSARSCAQELQQRPQRNINSSAEQPRQRSRARERMVALPVKGPLRSGWRWRSTRRAACTMHAVFRRCMDAPPKNSATARGPAAQDARRARSPGALLWATFLDYGHPALRPSGRLRRSRRSCGAADTAKKCGSGAFSDRKLLILHRSTAHMRNRSKPITPAPTTNKSPRSTHATSRRP
jgi:hypothetical protein